MRRLPKADCSTLGARLIVVAHRNVPEQAVKSMTKTLFRESFIVGFNPSPRAIYTITPTSFIQCRGVSGTGDKPVAVNQFMEGVNSSQTYPVDECLRPAFDSWLIFGKRNLENRPTILRKSGKWNCWLAAMRLHRYQPNVARRFLSNDR